MKMKQKSFRLPNCPAGKVFHLVRVQGLVGIGGSQNLALHQGLDVERHLFVRQRNCSLAQGGAGQELLPQIRVPWAD